MNALQRYISSDPAPRGTLFLVTHYDWMKPYVQTALRELWTAESALVAVVNDDAERRDFAHLPQQRVHFVQAPQGWLRFKLFMLYSRSVERAVRRAVKQYRPRVVLSLSTDHSTWLWLPRLQRRVPVIYTAHNVKPHRYTHTSWAKHLFYNTMYATPLRHLVRTMRHKLVNARWQQRWVQQHLPGHKVGFLPFPSLVTPQIADGSDVPPEIAGEHGYILFFGLVEHYKGVERLLQIYAHTPQLQRHKLVIAGKGNLERPVPPSVNDKVIRIARYLPDSEVAALMQRACLVVYPYLAATQSGVLSLASFFGCPMVVSDVPFFRDTAEGFDGVTIADTADTARFADAMLRTIEAAPSSRPLYDAVYARTDWRNDFERMVDDFFYN